MQKLFLIVGSSLLLSLLSIHPTSAQSVAEVLRDLLFVMPEGPDSGNPGKRDTGGTRGDCDAEVSLADTEMTALIPKLEHEYVEDEIAFTGTPQVWGQTTVDYPTFWFEVIDAPAETTFELRLQGSDGSFLYQTVMPVPVQTGTFSVAVPPTAEPLLPDNSYYWKAVLNYDCSEEESNSMSVDGWVQQVTPSDALSNELTTATPEEAVVLYAQAGIWFDALNGLAVLYLEHPDDAAIQAGWESLLGSIGLTETMFPGQTP